MPLVSTIISAHTHKRENGSTLDVEASPIIRVPKHLIYPNSGSSWCQKIASCIPVVGLFVAAHLFHQKKALDKEYLKLEYAPNGECSDSICSLVDAGHLSFALTTAVLGGLGLLLPVIILLVSVLLIFALVSKIRSCCCPTSKTLQ